MPSQLERHLSRRPAGSLTAARQGHADQIEQQFGGPRLNVILELIPAQTSAERSQTSSSSVRGRSNGTHLPNKVRRRASRDHLAALRRHVVTKTATRNDRITPPNAASTSRGVA